MSKPNDQQKQQKQIPLQFDRAEIPEQMSLDLIKKYHSHLINAKIAYLYKNKPMMKGGKTIFATAEKCSPKSKALITYAGTGEAFDFIITINYTEWQNLSDRQKAAVLDHELSHCLVQDNDETGETEFKLVSHDLEEFASIVSRHGLYMDSISVMAQAIEDSETPKEQPKPR